MAIIDNNTGIIHTECPECLENLWLDVPHVQDNQSGIVYCGALCHHRAFYGYRAPLTQAEDYSLQRAREWAKRER